MLRSVLLAVCLLCTAAPSALASEVFPTNPPVAVAFHGSDYFVGGTGRFEGLYRSDGTRAGTSLVKHVAPPDGLQLWGLTVRGDELVFSSWLDYAPAPRYYVSDGTARGTRRVRTPPAAPPGRVLARMTDGGTFFVGNRTREDHLGYLPPGPGAVPVDLGRVGSALAYGVLDREFFFVGQDAGHGAEPWVSDGTALGTHLVADLNPGPASSDFQSAVDPGNTYPSAFVPAGASMYVLAGRPDGVSNVPDTPYLLTGPAPGSPVTVEGSPALVPLAAQSRGTPDALWFQAGGVPATTRYRVAAGSTIAEPAAGQGFDEHGTLIAPGARLWISANSLRSADAQGTVTTLATTGLSAPSKSGPEPAIDLLTRVGDGVWFLAPVVDDGPFVFWRSDGTPSGTGPVVLPGQIDPVASIVTADVERRRRARAPFRWRISGTVVPQGIAPGTAPGLCRGRVSMRWTARGHDRTLSRVRTTVRWDGDTCRFARTLAPPRRVLTAGRGRLTIAVDFDGTAHVSRAQRTARVAVRYG